MVKGIDLCTWYDSHGINDSEDDFRRSCRNVSNSPFHVYRTHPDDHKRPTHDMTPRFITNYLQWYNTIIYL